MSLEIFDFIQLTEDLDIPEFSCSDTDLNNFIHDDAKPYLKELMAVTYLFVDKRANKTGAYFSLLNDKISYRPSEKSNWNKLNRKVVNRKRRKSYPSVKLGRLAVSNDYSGNGVGSDILNFIKHAFTHGNRTGCRFITVDAYSSAVGFYKKNGFEFFTDKDSGEYTRLMYFDLKPLKENAN
ncbi:MAG: GNAT family N-acetyltransferase [Paludibacteraceae bacterium]|nr:GNAT family N-acetyltransferase [Paludibacteraceae bacterium]